VNIETPKIVNNIVQKIVKSSNNSLVNDLTKEIIDDIILLVFTQTYSHKKGKKKNFGFDFPVPYIINIDGHYWANPFAFSWTKTFGKGYPTLPYKIKDEGIAVKHTSTKKVTKKSTWVPRIPIHTIIWRWANNYHQIPVDCDVSHLSGQTLLLDPDSFTVEKGVINRSRNACFTEKWYDEKHGNCKCSNCIRCPHIPICRAPINEPEDEIFKSPNNCIPGIPERY